MQCAGGTGALGPECLCPARELLAWSVFRVASGRTSMRVYQRDSMHQYAQNARRSRLEGSVPADKKKKPKTRRGRRRILRTTYCGK